MQTKWSVSLKELKLKIPHKKVKKEGDEDLTDSKEVGL